MRGLVFYSSQAIQRNHFCDEIQKIDFAVEEKLGV